MITLNSPIPSAEVFRHGSSGPEMLDMQQYCANGISVLFALPAAFSPTCTEKQLPGYVRESANFIASGVNRIACISVNDSFVMNAWGRQLGAIESGIDMLADANATFTRAIGGEIDLSAAGLNIRSKRYAMIVKNGTVVYVALEEDAGKMTISSAESTLGALPV